MKATKDASDYIHEFYDRIHSDYPHISFNQVDNICRANFRMVKKEFESGSLRNIRLRYFGVFTVYRGRAKGLLSKTENMLTDGKITTEIRDYIKRIVTEYFKREYNEDVPC